MKLDYMLLRRAESWPSQHQNIRFNLENLSVVTLLGARNSVLRADSFNQLFVGIT